MNQASPVLEALQHPVVKRRVRYKIAYLKLKRHLLSNRPRSEQELHHRIEEYLRAHPETAKIMMSAGVTVNHLSEKFLPYAR